LACPTGVPASACNLSPAASFTNRGGGVFPGGVLGTGVGVRVGLGRGVRVGLGRGVALCTGLGDGPGGAGCRPTGCAQLLKLAQAIITSHPPKRRHSDPQPSPRFCNSIAAARGRIVTGKLRLEPGTLSSTRAYLISALVVDALNLSPTAADR
jgi:hypothetical protein